jgi:transcriptional regulator with XRE-family HTH domain
MSVNRTSLGKRISFYRSKSNLTQEVLAAKVNCSREYIVQIENGTKAPSLSVLVKIANTLSVSADELLLDCLEYSSSSANSEIHRLLLDCNETEQTVIIRMVQDILHTHHSIFLIQHTSKSFPFDPFSLSQMVVYHILRLFEPK